MDQDYHLNQVLLLLLQEDFELLDLNNLDTFHLVFLL